MKIIELKKEEIKMKKILIFTILLLLVFLLAVDVVKGALTNVNPDKPLKG